MEKYCLMLFTNYRKFEIGDHVLISKGDDTFLPASVSLKVQIVDLFQF